MCRRPHRPGLTAAPDTGGANGHEAGTTGYLLKDTPRELVCHAVRAAAAGEAVPSPPVANRLIGQVRRPAGEVVSDREQEILALVAGGATNRQIATRLFISEASVKTHLLHLYAKLGVNDRAAAVAEAFDRGLLTPADRTRRADLEGPLPTISRGRSSGLSGLTRDGRGIYLLQVSNEGAMVGINGRHLRPHNRSALLRLLRLDGPLPRAVLASRAGLSATTVTKVVNELLADGVVEELGVQSRPAASRRGRPAIDVALVPTSRVVCGIQIGVGVVRVAVCDLTATLLRDETFTFERGAAPAEVLDRIASTVPRLVDQAGFDLTRVIGIGVGAPGPVDRALRTNLVSIRLGWHDVAVSDPLEQALGIPTVVDHNVRAMAVAEARYGLGRGLESLAFVYVRAGVGAGLVLNGQPYRGGTHGAAEIGHLRVTADPVACHCGSTGCLETMASEGALHDRAVVIAAAEPRSPLARSIDDGRSPVDALVDAALADDPAALDALSVASGHLATGLANLANLLDPQLIIVGGLYSEVAAPVLPLLRRQLRPQLFPVLRDAVRLEPTGFGASVGVVGAAAVALDRFFYGVEAAPSWPRPSPSPAPAPSIAP